MYQAASLTYERCVVCKVKKPENQMTYMYTFIVTNIERLIAGIPHKVLLQKRSDGELHQRKQIGF